MNDETFDNDDNPYGQIKLHRYTNMLNDTDNAKERMNPICHNSTVLFNWKNVKRREVRLFGNSLKLKSIAHSTQKMIFFYGYYN